MGLRFQLTKRGGIRNSIVDEYPENDQCEAEQEGNSPAIGQERFGRCRAVRNQQSKIGQHHAGWDTSLDDAAVQPAPRSGGILRREQDCAAPLTAYGETLRDSQQHQRER